MRVGINSCEPPRANGAQCSRDVECAGWRDLGTCKAIVGTCKAIVGAGTACSRDAVCRSGRCEFGSPRALAPLPLTCPAGHPGGTHRGLSALNGR